MELPFRSINPFSFQFVFASGKNRTAVCLSAIRPSFQGMRNGNILYPKLEIGESWKNTGFNASAWYSGRSGFGYGDNDDSTVLNNVCKRIHKKGVHTN